MGQVSFVTRFFLFTSFALHPTFCDEYCISDVFNATCGPQEIVMMTSATHGRMRSGKCIKMDYDKERCQKDAMKHLDGACSGRQTCSFPVAALREMVQVCSADLSTYLDASYDCLKVASSQCPLQRPLIVTSQTGGFLQLLASDRSMHQLPPAPPRVGSIDCPWRVTLDPRQRIRFSLYAFGTDPKAVHPGSCPVSVVFEDRSDTSSEKLCRSTTGVRRTTLYTSRSNSVNLYITGGPSDGFVSGAYVIQYEALGCPTLRVPSGAFSSIGETTATVRCNRTDETWFLSCEENQWKGEIGNCSNINSNHDAMARESDMTALTTGLSSLPYGLATAVIIGVLLGILVGSVPLGLAYVCFKRKWSQSPGNYVRDSIYDMELNKAVDEDGRPIYPALMQSTGGGQGDLTGGAPCGTAAGRQSLLAVDYCYGAYYPPGFVEGHVLHCNDNSCSQLQQQQQSHQQHGHQCGSVEAKMAGVPMPKLRAGDGSAAGDGCMETTCLDVGGFHLQTGCGSRGAPGLTQEHVYESAATRPQQQKMMSVDQLHRDGLLSVYYEVEGGKGGPVLIQGVPLSQ